MAERAYRRSWLCPTPEDRQRVLDMEQRLKRVRIMVFAGLSAALLATGPWIGWWTLPAVAVALLGFLAVDRRLASAQLPEYLVALAWLLSVAMITISCIKTGGVHSPALPWLAIPAVTLPARFHVRGVLVGLAVTVGVSVGVSFGVDASATWHNPVPLIYDLALVGSVVGFSLALMNSDLQHRSQAFIDPVTGMLNRTALQARTAELAEQSRINHEPVALILGDLDCFKAVNDRYGHAAGDAVLKHVAYRVRGELRAYDAAYRLGGEEFLVLLPGANAEGARHMAEVLRGAIELGPAADIPVTMSFGVSVSGEQFDYPSLFAAADEALYVAKREGRNRVRLAGEGGEARSQPIPLQRTRHGQVSPVA